MSKKRTSFILTALLALFCTAFCIIVYHKESDGRALLKIAANRAESELNHNSLLSHFTYKNPKKAGLSQNITLPIYQKENQTLIVKKDKADLEALHELDFSHCSRKDELQTLRNALVFSLRHNLQLSKYSYFEEPFSPYGGVQNELPILLTEYRMDCADDIDNYLKILSLLPDYLYSLCQFEQEKAENGLFMCDEHADIAIHTLDHFCELPDAKNPYLTTFESRIKELLACGKISKQEYTYYTNENERMIKTVVFPAFKKVGDRLTLLKAGDKSAPTGLCHYPQGKEYYEALLRSILGEDLSVSAVKNSFCRQLQSDYTELNALLSENTDYFMSVMDNEKAYDPLTALSGKDCMDFLQKQIGEDFGETPASKYPYEIKTVDSSMETYTNPAYYFTPPLDQMRQNIIYINPSQTQKGITLFTTLAHEGFPGHLYQAVTSGSFLQSQNLPLLSVITYFGGYTEGYATYVEFLSYDYAKKAAAQIAGNDQASLYYDFVMYERRIRLNLYSILDIMIHYEGAAESDIIPFLKRIGVTKEEDIHALYSYIASEPCTYVKYFGGYMQILECKNLAKDIWGEQYNEQAFHELLLRLGPIDFFSLKNEIRAEAP